jgi:hypothetical protein
MTKQQVERDILVLNRYALKKDYAPKGLHKGDVVLHIRNSKGVEYFTTLRRNKAHSCTCVSRKQCYHILRCKDLENARYAAAKAVPTVAQAVIVATPVAIEEYRMSDAVYAKLKATTKPAQEAQCKQQWDRGKHCLVFVPQSETAEERMLQAALTRNKAFSIL